MVYESDFYTTRRYRTSPSLTSYTYSKREIPWEKVPFVPRPSLVPDPVTAFGKKKSPQEEIVKPQRKSILHPEERAKIKPKAYLEPVKPYVSARELTKEKVFTSIFRSHNQPNAESMDYVLPRLHRVSECPDLPYKRRMVNNSDLPPVCVSKKVSSPEGIIKNSSAIHLRSLMRVPSRQVRILPGIGKVHVSYSYDNLVPYAGHKRLTVVTLPPKVYSTRPSILQREYDRIENKLRPWTGYSAVNRYLNSDSAVRSYYLSYPISGYDSSYYTVNLPSSYYSPRLYRWYYSWPREYSFSSYWPYYRTFLSSYLRNYYLNNYWPYSYYWSTYLPYYRSLDYEFSELENKIDNLRDYADLSEKPN